MRTKVIQARHVHAGDKVVLGGDGTRRHQHHVSEFLLSPTGRPEGVKTTEGEDGYVMLRLSNGAGLPSSTQYYNLKAPIRVRI